MFRNQPRALLALPLLLAVGCGGSDDDGGTLPFVIRSTSQSVAGTTIVRISGRSVAYLADEASTAAGGSQFNTDADVIDSVAFIVDFVSGSQTNTRIAAQDMLWIGSDLYLLVDEALDEVDWNMDMDTMDQVLLRWRGGGATLVAELEPGQPIVQSGSRVFFVLVDPGAGPGLGMTTLAYVEAANPTTPQPVDTDAANAAGLRPSLIGEDEGLVFVTADENLDGDLNGDADGVDAFVLGVVDSGAAMPRLHNVGLAVAGASVPFRAYATGASDWLVGFLVNEAAEAENFATGLNDRTLFAMAWEPSQCSAANDTDTTDNVLFFLNFAAFIDAMMPVPPVNTGLAGVDRVVVVDGYVGTISPEADAAGCDLNQDTDTTDRIFRWTAAVTPVLPATSAAVLHALAPPANVPGGTFGIAELEDRWVALVSETEDGRDHNADAIQSLELLGWFDPAASMLFQFDHGDGGAFYAGADWMLEDPLRQQLFTGRPEVVEGTNENTLFGADMDTLDRMPTLHEFRPAGGGGVRMAVPAARLAAQTRNAGIIVVGDLTMYRVSEAEETLDWNGDGDMTDFVLFRSTQSNGFTTSIGLINDLTRPAAEANRFDSTIFGAAIITDESYSGSDLNGDGDAMDYVLRHFRL